MNNYKNKKKSKLKPYNAVIQVCDKCGKIDVSEGHEKECDPILEKYREESMDNFYK